MAYKASDWLDGVDTVREGGMVLARVPEPEIADCDAAFYRGYKAGRNDAQVTEFAELFRREQARGNWWQGVCWLTWLCVAALGWGMLGM